mgnify:CR=1 FL=1
MWKVEAKNNNKSERKKGIYVYIEEVQEHVRMCSPKTTVELKWFYCHRTS